MTTYCNNVIYLRLGVWLKIFWCLGGEVYWLYLFYFRWLRGLSIVFDLKTKSSLIIAGIAYIVLLELLNCRSLMISKLRLLFQGGRLLLFFGFIREAFIWNKKKVVNFHNWEWGGSYQYFDIFSGINMTYTHDDKKVVNS